MENKINMRKINENKQSLLSSTLTVLGVRIEKADELSRRLNLKIEVENNKLEADKRRIDWKNNCQS